MRQAGRAYQPVCLGRTVRARWGRWVPLSGKKHRTTLAPSSRFSFDIDPFGTVNIQRKAAPLQRCLLMDCS